MRLIGPPEAPTHFALATNSPVMRIFDIQTLNCTATLAGHTDTVLVMDTLHTKGMTLEPSTLISRLKAESLGLFPSQNMMITGAQHTLEMERSIDRAPLRFGPARYAANYRNLSSNEGDL